MLVMRECPCVDTRCVGVAPMDEEDAQEAVYAPCPLCRTTEGRVFWFTRHTQFPANVTFLRVKETVQ